MRRSDRGKRAALAQIFVAWLFAFLFVAAPIAAPPARAQEDTIELRGDPAVEAAERQELFAALAAAPNASDAHAVSMEIWALWFRAPNAEAAAQMQEALDHRNAHDYAGSAKILDELVESEPDWAEAWNQRATMRYVLRDFEGSLADISHVLDIEPKHFGALSGQALILMHQGKMAAGQLVLRKAVEIYPFLSERALLMDPDGQDI